MCARQDKAVTHVCVYVSVSLCLVVVQAVGKSALPLISGYLDARCKCHYYLCDDVACDICDVHGVCMRRYFDNPYEYYEGESGNDPVGPSKAIERHTVLQV